MTTAKTKINIIIGDPVEHSLSPQMHNSAYKQLGIDNKFVYLAAHVKPEDLQAAILGARAMQINGITVTIPHKTNVMYFLDEIEETAAKIGAVNTIVNRNGALIGINTDWIGVAEPLKQVTDLNKKNVAIIGAGGFSHAAVFAMVTNNALVTIYNRTIENARELAKKFNCKFAGLDKMEEIKKADIIINATSVGMQTNKSIIAKELLHKNQIIFDAVYVPFETQLIKNAKEVGATVIHGTELLLFQGVAQFELFTNKKAPIDGMRNAIMENIKI